MINDCNITKTDTVGHFVPHWKNIASIGYSRKKKYLDSAQAFRSNYQFNNYGVQKNMSNGTNGYNDNVQTIGQMLVSLTIRLKRGR